VFVAFGLFGSGKAGAAGEGEMCGGIAGIPCKEGLWCDPELGQCGGADIAGVCVVVGDICLKNTKDFRPVCGCDDHTYGNDCERRAAKVAKASDGACDPEKCKEINDPVCATKDGKRTTYANDCRAKRSGATDISKGACEDAK
jgi:hypothetical protein